MAGGVLLSEGIMKFVFANRNPHLGTGSAGVTAHP
jgi:hypothetical protein